MAETTHRLNIEINTRATSSGSSANSVKHLNNLRDAALTTAKAFGPMAARINQAFASLAQQRQATKDTLFSGISSGMKEEITKIDAGLGQLRNAASLAGKNMDPVRQAVRDSIADVGKFAPAISTASRMMQVLGKEGALSGEQIIALNTGLSDAASTTKGKLNAGIMDLKTQLAAMGEAGEVSGSQVKWLGSQFDDLLIKATKLPQPLRQAITAFSGSIPTTEAATRKWITLAEVASTLVVPGFESMSAAFGNAIPPLESLASALAMLKLPPDVQLLFDLFNKGVPKTEAAAIALRDAANVVSQNTNPRFAELVAYLKSATAGFNELVTAASNMKLTPEMGAVQKDFAGAPPTTSQGANKIFKDMQVAAQTTIPEYQGIVAVMASVGQEADKLTTDLEELSTAERRNRMEARGMKSHTEEANEALMATQSIAQGAMMGYAAMRGSVLQLGFGLIFMRFSAINLVLSMAVLVAVLGNFYKILMKFNSALIANGKIFIQQEALARRFELDSAKKVEAYGAVTKAAIRAGRTTEEFTKSWEIAMAKGVASAELTLSANDLAAATGVTLDAAMSKMMETIDGGGDSIETYVRSLGEVDKQVIRNIKAQWNLMTPLEKTGFLIQENAKYYKDAGKEYAMQFDNLKTSIKGAWEYSTGFLGRPFVEKFLSPMLNSMKEVGEASVEWVDSFMASKTGIALMKDLSKTGKMAADLIKSAFEGIGDVVKAVLPPFIRFVNVALRTLVIILTPLAKNIKLVGMALTILGIIMVKTLGATIIGSITKLTVFKKAIDYVTMAITSGLNSGLVIAAKDFKNLVVAQASSIKWAIREAGAIGGIKKALVIMNIWLEKGITGILNFGKAMMANPWMRLLLIITLIALTIMKNQKAMEAWQRVLAAFQPILVSISDLFATFAEILSGGVVPILNIVVEIIAFALVPVLKIIANILEKVAWAINQLGTRFKFLIPILKIALTSIILLKIATMSATKAIVLWNWVTTIAITKTKLWTIATRAAAAAQWAWDAAMAANPIGLIVIAIVACIAAVVALYKYWEKIPPWARYLAAIITPLGWIVLAIKEWDNSMARLKSVISTVGKALTTLGNVLDKVLNPLVEVVHWIMGGSPGLLPALKKVTPVLLFFTRFIRQLASPLWTIVTALKQVVTWLGGLPNKFKAFALQIGDAFSLIPGIVGDFFYSALDVATEAWSTANADFQIIVEGVGATFDTIVNTVSTAFTNACTAAGVAWNGAVTLFTGIVTGIGVCFDAVITTATTTFGTACTAASTAWSTATTAFDSIASNIGQCFDVVVDTIAGFFTSALDASKKVFDNAFGTATAVFNTVATGIGNSFNVVTGIIGSIFTTAFSEATKIATVAWNGIKFLLSDMGAWFTEFVVIPLAMGFNILIQAYKDSLGKLPGAPHIALIDIDFIREQIEALKEAAKIAQETLTGGETTRGTGNGTGAVSGYGHPVYEMAKGGITLPNRPIRATIGEGREREVVAPLSDLSRLMGPVAQSPTINVYVTGNSIMDEDMVNSITDQVAGKVSKAMNRFRPISTVGY